MFDFHLVSENERFQSYQAMTKLETTQNEVTGVAPTKYGPTMFTKVDGKDLVDAIKQFHGYEIDGISLSHDGLVVRVVRPKDSVVDPEPEIRRLEGRK